MSKVYPDISHHQSVKDWNLFQENVGFAISKATEGTNFVDPTLSTFINECEKRKIPYWLYTFLRYGDELAQTKFMVQTCKNKVGKYFCGYILDIERNNKESSCLTALNWLKLQSKKTMIYIGWSDAGMYKNLIQMRGENCAWWEARYGKNNGIYNSNYPCHDGVDLHQFSENGKCPGVPSLVDVNRVTGNKPESWFMTPNIVPTTKPVEPVKNTSEINRTIRKTGEITASYLNIRTEPTVDSSKLKSYPVLPKGTQVGICDEVINNQGDKWYFIRYNGKYGYASAKYIKILE